MYHNQYCNLYTGLYSWYQIAGFCDTSEVPFHSKEESILKYGVWQEDQGDSSPKPDHKMSWDELQGSFRNNLPELFLILDKLSAPSFAEWIELADNICKDHPKVSSLAI